MKRMIPFHGRGGFALVGLGRLARPRPAIPKGGFGTAKSFDSISDRGQRSVALFEEAGKVIQNPRCMNCHPAGDTGRAGRRHASA